MSIEVSGYQVDSHFKSLAFGSIRAAKQGKSFEPRKDVFHDRTVLCQETVLSFLLPGKRVMLAFLVG